MGHKNEAQFVEVLKCWKILFVSKYLLHGSKGDCRDHIHPYETFLLVSIVVTWLVKKHIILVLVHSKNQLNFKENKSEFTIIMNYKKAWSDNCIGGLARDSVYLAANVLQKLLHRFCL